MSVGETLAIISFIYGLRPKNSGFEPQPPPHYSKELTTAWLLNNSCAMAQALLHHGVGEIPNHNIAKHKIYNRKQCVTTPSSIPFHFLFHYGL